MVQNVLVVQMELYQHLLVLEQFDHRVVQKRQIFQVKQKLKEKKELKIFHKKIFSNHLYQLLVHVKH